MCSSKRIHGRLHIRDLGMLFKKMQVGTYKVQWRTGWLGIDGAGKFELEDSKARLLIVSYLLDC